MLFRSLLLMLSILPFAGQSQVKVHKFFPPPGVPRNIIIVIVPGMGFPHLSTEAIMNHGQLNLSKFPYTGYLKPWNGKETVTPPQDVIRRISEGVPEVKKKGLPSAPNKSLFEISRQMGMSTGFVVTGSVTDRDIVPFYYQGTDTTDEKLAEDLWNAKVDIMMGGGRRYFEKRSDKRNLTDSFEKRGYELETKEKKVQNMAKLKALGLFENDALPRANYRSTYLYDASFRASNLLQQEDMGYILIVESNNLKQAVNSGSQQYIADEIKELDDLAGKYLKYFENPGSATLLLIMGDQQYGDYHIKGGNPEKGNISTDNFSKGYSGALVPVFAAGAGAENFKGIMAPEEIYEQISKFIIARR